MYRQNVAISGSFKKNSNKSVTEVSTWFSTEAMMDGFTSSAKPDTRKL